MRYSNVVRVVALAFALAMSLQGACHPAIEDEGAAKDSDTRPDGGDDTGDTIDTDTGSDSDSGTDTVGDCPLNSGYPCTCSIIDEPCDDSSWCAQVVGLSSSLGICSKTCECTELGLDCVETAFTSESVCGMVDDNDDPSWCGCALFICDDDDDCPYDQTCQDYDVPLCYPI